MGKLLHYQLSPAHHRGLSGQYLGRVVKVQRLKRGHVRSVTVQRPSFDRGRLGWKGTRVRLVPNDWQLDGCGILYRREIVPVQEFAA